MSHLHNSKLPRFLVHLINNIAEREKFSNYTITATSAISEAGFVNQTITISGQRSNNLSSITLTCKTPPSTTADQELFHSRDAFDSELEAYNTILPQLIKYQQEQGLLDDGFTEFPQCYGNFSDPVRCDYIIALQNMHSIGFHRCEIALDYNHAVLALNSIGKLHGISLAMRHHRPIVNLKKTKSKWFLQMLKDPNARKMVDNHFEKAIKSLRPNETELIANMEQLRIDYLDSLEDCCDKTPELYRVWSHGALCIQNMVFKYENRTRPVEMCFLEWHNMQLCSPALDLSSLLFGAIDVKVCREFYEEMIWIYYNSVVDTMQRLLSNSEAMVLSWRMEELLEQMKLYAKYGFIAVPMMQSLIEGLVKGSEGVVNFGEYEQKNAGDFIRLFFEKNYKCQK